MCILPQHENKGGSRSFFLFARFLCGQKAAMGTRGLPKKRCNALRFHSKEIVIYDFPVGTEIRVTDDAIAQGYSLMTFDYERAYYETGVTITYADVYRAYIGLYRFPDEETTEEIDFYVRGVNTDTRFTDVKESDYCAEAVEWAVKYGITNGTSATTFSPDKTCTRGEIVTFLCRAMANQ